MKPCHTAALALVGQVFLRSLARSNLGTIARFIFVISFLCLVPQCAYAAGASSSIAPGEPASIPQPRNSAPHDCFSGEVRDGDKITVAGCLVLRNDVFSFITYSGKPYELIDNKVLLKKHVDPDWYYGANVCIEGMSSAPLAMSPIRIYDLPQPKAELSRSIITPTQWEAHTYSKYGLNIWLPKAFETATDIEASLYVLDLPIDRGTIPVARFAIPADAFSSDRNSSCDARAFFWGGGLTVNVNPNIHGVQKCGRFGSEYGGSENRSSHKLNGVEYSEGTTTDGAMNVEESYYFYHTFQNGLCYEFAFSSDQSDWTPESGEGCDCAIAKLSDPEYEKLAREVMRRVSFFEPRETKRTSNDRIVSPKNNR